jgi:hypothetical protein
VLRARQAKRGLSKGWRTAMAIWILPGHKIALQKALLRLKVAEWRVKLSLFGGIFLYSVLIYGAYYPQGGDSMRAWRIVKDRLRQAWYRRDRQKILVFIMIGVSLLAGIGVGMYRTWPSEEPAATAPQLSLEDLEAVVEERVSVSLPTSTPGSWTARFNWLRWSRPLA